MDVDMTSHNSTAFNESKGIISVYLDTNDSTVQTDLGPRTTASTQDVANSTETCVFEVDYDILSSCIAVTLIIFGVLLTFFGYRFFKAIIFMSGFLFGSILTYVIIVELDILPPEGDLGIAVGAGFLVGLITMLIPLIGLFMTGLNLGVAITTIILVVIEQFTHLTNKWIPIGMVAGIGVICGILTLRCQKGMTIAGTSVIGAAMGLAGGDYFIELSKMAMYVWDRVMAVTSPDLCWYSWVIFGSWAVVAAFGILVQAKFTGAGVDHNLTLRSRREQGVSLQQERARQKRESQQTRYRHLYQARRVKGDVISQNFFHSIQDKLSPAMRSLTALNTEPANEEESTATTTLTQIT